MAGTQGNLPSEEGVAGRWVAEPVALSPEEAAISLEAEMFRTFASMPEALTVSGAELESSPMSGVSAITATVENRLAEAELAARSKASTNGAESCSDESGAEATAGQASAEIAPAEAMAGDQCRVRGDPTAGGGVDQQYADHRVGRQLACMRRSRLGARRSKTILRSAAQRAGRDRTPAYARSMMAPAPMTSTTPLMPTWTSIRPTPTAANDGSS